MDRQGRFEAPCVAFTLTQRVTLSRCDSLNRDCLFRTVELVSWCYPRLRGTPAAQAPLGDRPSCNGPLRSVFGKIEKVVVFGRLDSQTLPRSKLDDRKGSQSLLI